MPWVWSTEFFWILFYSLCVVGGAGPVCQALIMCCACLVHHILKFHSPEMGALSLPNCYNLCALSTQIRPAFHQLPLPTTSATQEKLTVQSRGALVPEYLILALPLTGRETRGRVLCPLLPWFPHVESRDIVEQTAFIIFELLICRFIYWVQFICNP